MRVVIYGVGKLYKNRSDEIAELFADDVVVAFLDNKFKTDMEIEGIPARNPRCVNSILFDRIVIVSVHVEEIYSLLLKYGVDKRKICTWKEYRAEKTGSVIDKYDATTSGDGKMVLIVASPIRYDGGSMAVVYAALALRARNYCVWVSAEYIEIELKEKLLSAGINLAICKDIPYTGENFKNWVKLFSIVIVNVFPNIHSAYELGKIKPLVWWIHESDVYGKIYQKTFSTFPWYREGVSIDTVNVVAVSDKAKNNFQRYYPKIGVRIMPYGLPDESGDNEAENETMIFAIIGNVSYLKGQDIFIQAAIKAMADKGTKAEFWIIGNQANEYAEALLTEAERFDFIKVKGEINRVEMVKYISRIDVIVSSSREDSLPIVVVEGMMNSKACIMSDVIGSVKYVTNYKNGIIFESQNIDDLADKMRWCIGNRDEVKKIGKEARKTYTSEFSMEKFADRLEKEIEHAENIFRQ